MISWLTNDWTEALVLDIVLIGDIFGLVDCDLGLGSLPSGYVSPR